MTREEAILAFANLAQDEVFIRPNEKCETFKDFVDRGDLSIVTKAIDVMMSVDQPYNVVGDVLAGSRSFLTMDGIPTGDDYDYVILDLEKNTFFVWTEVGGNEYDIKQLNVTYRVK